MGGFFKWVKDKTSAALDTDRDVRVSAAARAVELAIREQREQFDFGAFYDRLTVYAEDKPAIAENVYANFLGHAWRDCKLEGRERSSLKWIADRLSLSSTQRQKVEAATATKVFREAFIQGVSTGGRLSQALLERLRNISGELKMPLGTLLIREFPQEMVKAFDFAVRAVVTEESINKNAWSELSEWLRDAQVPLQVFQQSVKQRVHAVVESYLAAAKSDGEITSDEAAGLDWLLKNLVIDTKFIDYVTNECDRVIKMQKVRAGFLPSLEFKYPGLRAGEIVHLVIPKSEYLLSRKTKKSGVQTSDFAGMLIVTDVRLIFASALKTVEIPHRRVAMAERQGNYVEIQSSSKGSGAYLLSSDPEFDGLLYEVAIRRANQTIIQKTIDAPSRHISRDVRQRVFQKYSGRCVDCGAADYLEFDHIIPVAKGGSNGENNVQLLCRRCNGKKSDHI